MSLVNTIRQKLAGAAGAPPANVSIDYRRVGDESVGRIADALRDSWQDPSIPDKQRALVDPQLDQYRQGASLPVFDALVDILQTNIPRTEGMRLLEVGCSSGYYAEVFAIKGIAVQYEGCDYSPAFIDLARRIYPDIRFEVRDATRLEYADAGFDIVVSGGCILHIPDYERAVAEAARVASRWVVFHRTPVVHMGGPHVYTKKAYGVETVEIHFNEQSLLRLLRKHGLTPVDINTHSIGWEADKSDALAMKTYLCEKRAS